MKNFSLAVSLASSLFMTGCLTQSTLTPLTLAPVTPPPQTVTLQMTNYTPKAGRIYQQLFVSNFSIKPGKGTLSPETARDGLTDDLKNAHASDYGFNLSGPNSANPFFSDMMLYLTGIPSTQQNLLYCASNLQLSSSNDALIYSDTRANPSTSQFLGLRDCEKTYLGLDPNKFDFDGDGIPDYLELRCGLNPKNPNDASLSISGDGLTNLEKCRRNIPTDENANSQPNALFQYNYDLKLQGDGSTTFTISNVPILNNGKDNFIAFYLTEQNTTTLQSYLYTAFMILPSGAQSKTYHFPFWGVNAGQYTNQEILFQ
jgi:hypothetical protein